MEFYARPGQLLIDHLNGVADRTETFAGEFGNADWGHWLGKEEREREKTPAQYRPNTLSIHAFCERGTKNKRNYPRNHYTYNLK